MSVLHEYAGALSQPALSGPGADEPARYDEVVGADGRLRPAWRGLAETATRLTGADLRRIDGDISAMLADDGVGQLREGPWQLDPLPLVLDAPEWSALEVGLAQRAELFNAVLADLYGAQRLLSDGLLPPALVLAHAGFLRVVARASALDPRPLVLAATDLGRDHAGQWRVVNDWAQAPSGLGFAMENRRVIAQVLPELYRHAGLHGVQPYVAALRSALLQSAQGERADPRVVVLSPGTRSAAAYDQAFLASALGFPLVQGSDLAVRDGWVWLEAADRRDRVDVVLRRVDATWSDPLELRGESRLGVAGLTEAVRRGRVRVVNGLGCGVVENPGLVPFLPAVCEALLDEPLRLSSVPTWWCGDAASLEEVLDRLGSPELLVRPIDGPSPVGLTARQLEDRIRTEPQRWVGQERLPLSSAPTWGTVGRTEGAIAARPVRLRTFTLRYGSAYRPFAGGLADVVERRATGDVAVATKDVWVLKASSTDLDQGLAEVLPMTAARSASVLMPRVLEDLFWLGRYAERAEDMLRLVLTAIGYAESHRARPRSAGAACLRVLLDAASGLAGPGLPDLDQEFRSLLLDPARAGTAADALERLRAAMQGVRDQLSPDVWRAFGTVDRAAAALHASPHAHQAAESAGRMLTGVLAVHGATDSMIRDPGWHLVEAGRHLERALQTTHLLAATVTTRRGLEVDRDVLTGVLAATESAVTHRRRYRGHVRPAGVLHLLLLDADNPRSLRGCLTAAATHLAAQHESTGSTRPERLLADLLADLDRVEVAALVAIGGADRPHLIAFLAATRASLHRVCDAIAELHLDTGPAPRSLSAFALTEVR